MPEHPLYGSLKQIAAGLHGEEVVKRVLGELGLTVHKACGFMLAENNAGQIDLTPYVYVRDVETFHAETACASGSIAVASIRGVPLSMEPKRTLSQAPATRQLL